MVAREICADIVHQLFGLDFDAARCELAIRCEADFTGEIEHVADAHGFGERIGFAWFGFAREELGFGGAHICSKECDGNKQRAMVRTVHGYTPIGILAVWVPAIPAGTTIRSRSPNFFQ